MNGTIGRATIQWDKGACGARWQSADGTHLAVRHASLLAAASNDNGDWMPLRDEVLICSKWAGIVGKDMVISIPSYATNVERQALLDAAEIANLKCLRVINESTAIVLNYGFFRKKDLDEKKERVVAFVDVGHCKTTITIASFKQGEAKILIHNSDRNLGGRDFDYEIMKVVGGWYRTLIVHAMVLLIQSTPHQRIRDCCGIKHFVTITRNVITSLIRLLEID